MNSLVTLSFFSGVSIPGGLILAAYFIAVRKEHPLKLNLIGGLFLAVTFRCAKSFVCFSLNMPDFGMILGYLGLASIGPFLWLYFKYLENDREETRISKNDYLHFLLPIIGMLSIGLFGRDVAIEYYFYTNWILTTYVVLSWIKFFNSNMEHSSLKVWNVSLLLTVTLLTMVFLFQYFTDYLINYTIGSVIASIIFCGLLFFALKTPVLFPKRKKTNKVNPLAVKKVRNAIEIQRLYKKPSLTLDGFSKLLNMPSYLVSKIVKKEYEKTFPETINYYRIMEVLKQLTNESNDLKIESLAYEVGFNTPSTFYVAFKKNVGMSPTEFQKAIQNQTTVLDLKEVLLN